MNQKKFLKRLAEEYAKNVEISTAKNADYADAEDAFANFRASEAFGIDPKVGLIVRILDKVMRANNLIKPGRIRKVQDEKIGDTLSDGANYMMILKLLIEDEDEKVINSTGFRTPTTVAYNDNIPVQLKGPSDFKIIKFKIKGMKAKGKKKRTVKL